MARNILPDFPGSQYSLDFCIKLRDFFPKLSDIFLRLYSSIFALYSFSYFNSHFFASTTLLEFFPYVKLIILTFYELATPCMAARSHKHYTKEAFVLLAFTKSISLGTGTKNTVLCFWNQYQVLLELLPRKLELVPRAIGTPPKIY